MDRGAPVSGQILFRAANGTSQPADLSQPPHPDPWSYSLGVGLLHAPPGAVAEEKVLPVLLAASRSGMAIRMHAAPQPMNRWDDETGRIEAIDGLLRTMDVPSPGGYAGLMSHGGLYLRRTRFPGPEGTVTHIVAAIMRHGPGQLPERTMYDLSGRAGDIALSGPVPAPGTFPMGSGVSTTLGMPIWRARDGLRGVASSLHLDLIDQCVEYAALEREPSRSPEQEARFEALRRGEARWVLAPRSDDSAYARFRALAAEMGVELSDSFARYPTADEIAARKQEMARVARAMHEGDEAPAPRMR